MHRESTPGHLIIFDVDLIDFYRFFPLLDNEFFTYYNF